MTARPIRIINNNFINNRNSRNKIIIWKTEVDLVKNFSNLNEIQKENSINEYNNIKDLNENYYKVNTRKINYLNNLEDYEYNSARSNKLNATDFNNYMNHLQKSNNNKRINTNKLNKINKENKISLIKYFNLNKINSDKKNANSIKTLYNNNIINSYKKSKYSSYNSYITKKNKTNFINDINSIYHETGKIINNNINNNINKIKKEKELLNHKRILAELKLKNYKLENELLLLKEKNIKLEQSKHIQNKTIFLKVKKVLTNNTIIKNKINNYPLDINDISDLNIINSFNIKKYKSLPYKERAKYIRNIYLQEKLKNSLIDKTFILYFQSHHSYDKSENKINGKTQTIEDININNFYNIYRWIASMVDNTDKLKKTYEKIQKDIKKLKEEKENYKNYYNNWINTLKINNKEELITKIDGLINYKNINENGHAKMIKILMNKKE